MCSLHMWIIYRLWGFLLLKPALGVLQIPAQSIATQSSLLSAESLTASLSHYDKKKQSLEIFSPPPLYATLLTKKNQSNQYQQAKSNCVLKEGV